MKSRNYNLQGKIWLYSSDKAAWHFVTLPLEDAAEISDLFALEKHGWGSLPVHVTVGQTTWKTSIFPDSSSDSYVLPIKAEVRKKESLTVGDEITYTLIVCP
jgi:hypothetical protein